MKSICAQAFGVAANTKCIYLLQLISAIFKSAHTAQTANRLAGWLRWTRWIMLMSQTVRTNVYVVLLELLSVWPWPRMMERQDYYVGKMWNANMIFKYMMLMGKLNCAEIKQRVKFSGEWLPLCSVHGWTNNTGAHHRRSIFLLLLFFCVQRIKQLEIRNFCISGYSNTRRGHS